MLKISVLAMNLLILISSFNVFAGPAYYEYDFADKNGNIDITLRFNGTNVSKYPGWKHSRKRSAHVSMWYPSLVDAASPNVWISSKEEQEKAKIKPSKNDRKIELTLGGIGSNYIKDPNNTVNGDLISACKKDGSFEKFIEDGRERNFSRYKTSAKVPNSLVKYLYLPIEKTKGIGCIKCNGATCQLFGVSDLGIEYTATEKYIESNMVEDFLNIHEGINKFIETKIVKN